MIAVAGEALIDAHVDNDLLRLFPGGGPFNTAIALARLGAPVCFLGAISRDRFGRQLEQALGSAGVETTSILHVDEPTPIAIIDATSGEPSYSFYLTGTAHEALRPADLEALPHHIAALHVGTLALATDPPGAAIADFAEHEARSRTLVVDPNVRPAVVENRNAYLRRFEHLSSLAGLVKLSAADLAWLYPDHAERDAARRLLESGTGCVVVTNGSEGAEAWTRSGSAKVHAPAVTVVDTVGAGDAFGAGLLASLMRRNLLSTAALANLERSELEGALAYGVAVAAVQCTRASAWGPTAADVDRLLTELDSTPGSAREENDGLARVR